MHTESFSIEENTAIMWNGQPLWAICQKMAKGQQYLTLLYHTTIANMHICSSDLPLVVSVWKSNSENGEILPICKPTVQAWNGNQTRQELQYRQGKCRGGSHLSHPLQDVRKEVCHGGTQLQRAQGEGGDTEVSVHTDQTHLKVRNQSVLLSGEQYRILISFPGVELEFRISPNSTPNPKLHL